LRELNEVVSGQTNSRGRLSRKIDAARGETDKAFESQQISFDNHDTGMVIPLTDPLLRGLRHDRRYKNLLQKRGSPAVL
jgi:hypothetical protein